MKKRACSWLLLSPLLAVTHGACTATPDSTSAGLPARESPRKEDRDPEPEDADNPEPTVTVMEPTDEPVTQTPPEVVVTVIGGDTEPAPPPQAPAEQDPGGDPAPVMVVDDEQSLSGALCDATAGPLRTAGVLRGTWDKHTGTTYQDFGGVSGYPCAGFAFQEIPPLDDPGWVPADDPTNIGFSEPSTFCMVDAGVPHGIGEFTYFRSNIWIPPATPVIVDGGVETPGFALSSLEVNLYGIDDSVKLWIYNSRHPDGYTPPNNAACAPNGNFTYDFGPQVVPNETNTIVMVHMDSQCATSALMTATISANGENLDPAVNCM